MKGKFFKNPAKGFTLVELMVVMFITIITALGMYKIMTSYYASSEIMDQMVELQQNCRIAMGRMAEEIRMAGYDPTTESGARINPSSDATKFIFSMDVNDDFDNNVEDGDVLDEGERISYSMEDLDGDGENDLVRRDLNSGDTQQVISNVSALEFFYLDKDGNPVGAGTLTGSVEIALVVKTSNEDFGYVDDNNYVTRRGNLILPSPNDNFRRRLIEQTVKCRNSGL